MPDAWSLAQVGRAVKEYNVEGPVLDVGAGTFSNWFRPHFEKANLWYVTLDADAHEGIDIVGTVPDVVLPYPHPTIMCLSVIEHTENPQVVVDWCIRNLLPRGHLFLAAPCSWPQHDYPHDYWRVLPDGVRWLMRDLEVLEVI